MKPPRWWAPVASALVALAFGVVPYGLLSSMGKLPLGLRDHPWPMEILAAAAALVTLALAVRAFRTRRTRAVATLSAALAVLGTTGFLLLVHVASFQLPPPPRELAVGAVAPDFTLPDETGHPVQLASLRGHPTLLVFYRGYW